MQTENKTNIRFESQLKLNPAIKIKITDVPSVLDVPNNILPQDCKDIFEKVTEWVQYWDESHNHIHALNVAKLSMKIINALKITDKEIIQLSLLLAYLHDICDHKYHNNNKKKRDDYIETHGFDLDMMCNLINDVSWSKQMRKSKGMIDINEFKNSDYTENQITALKIVRDADRLEAMGIKRGVFRICKFTLENPQFTEFNASDEYFIWTGHGYIHVYEKIGLLYDWLHYPTALPIAKVFKNEMLKAVNINVKKYNKLKTLWKTMIFPVIKNKDHVWGCNKIKIIIEKIKLQLGTGYFNVAFNKKWNKLIIQHSEID